MSKRIKTGQVVFPDRKKYKFKYTDEIADFCKKLLQKDKTKRLGHESDVTEILAHPWFKLHNIDVKNLESKKYKAPFLPGVNYE